MSRDDTARLWHAALTVLVLVALVWTFALMFADPQDASVPERMRVANFVSFFTIWSNVMVGFLAASLAIDPHRDGRYWRVLHLDALLCIVVTGVVHLVALRPLQDVSGAHAVSDNLLHVAVPLAVLTGWLVFGPRPRIDRRTIPPALVIPLAWIGYTLVRGEIVDWYPYPFLDVIEIGYARALVNIAVVAVVFLVLGVAASALDRRLTPPAAREPTTVT